MEKRPPAVQGGSTEKMSDIELDESYETITEMISNQEPVRKTPGELVLWLSARIRLRPAGLVTQIPAISIRSMNTMDEEEPTSYVVALNQSSSRSWKDAMRDEYLSLARNDIWSFTSINEVPGDMKSIGCRWVFRKKINSGMTTCFKARLVIKGYEQIPGIELEILKLLLRD